MRVRLIVLITIALVAVPAALAWPGRPSTRAPKPPNAGAPPPAWIENASRSTWLAYGSYCWKTACVNMIPPQSRPDLPLFATRRGGRVRVHLGFSPTSIDVSVDKRHVSAQLDRSRRIVSWRATRGGILTVFAKKGGDASYVTRLKLR